MCMFYNVDAPTLTQYHYCTTRHVKRAREDCPEVADFSLANPTSLHSNSAGGRAVPPGGFSRSFGGGSFGGGGGGAAQRGGGGGENAARYFGKNQMCKYWTSGTKCPWGDACNYAHGEVCVLYAQIGRSNVCDELCSGVVFAV